MRLPVRRELPPPGRVTGSLEIAAGATIVAGTMLSLVSTLVLPRRSQRSALEQSYLAGDPEAVREKRWSRVVSSRLATAVWHLSRMLFAGVETAVCRVYSLVRKREATPANVNWVRHRALWLLGPVALITLFALWLGGFLLGYGLILWPIVGHGFGEAMRMSTSSVFTLGFDAPAGLGATLVASFEAATGVFSAALEVSYLFTLYGHYSRREQLMRRLEGRAGYPALGPELLWREHEITALETLGSFYAEWETWAAEVTEAHLSYPWLLLFRSSDAMQSWVVSLLAVLDSAALYLALANPEGELGASQADHCLRMGFTAFREIALVFGIPVNFDPRPEDELQLPRGEFLKWAKRLEEDGFPAKRTLDEAWLHFRGWRVNYENIAYRLVKELDTVPAEWTGSSHPIMVRRPPHRRPAETLRRQTPV